jgi:methionyl-tRNA formyltransferase
MKRFKVAFCGTPEFSVPALDMLKNHSLIDLRQIISMPDRPSGRGMDLKSPEVIEYAKAHRLSFHQTENINRDSDFIQSLRKEELDFIVVLAFAQFLGEEMLNLAKHGCFNIHTSILPKYRGAAPIQYALLNGDTTTGVSIQRMVKKMDAGDLVHFHELQVSSTETGGQLYTRLKFQAALCLSEFIDKLSLGNISYTPQDESQVSFAPTLKKEDGALHFSEKTRTEIKNRVRALDPWPGTYCFLNGKRLKILSVEDYHRKIQAGLALNDMGSLIVGCSDGSLRLSQVQLEGKKPCSDRELLNGIKSDIHITSTKD